MSATGVIRNVAQWLNGTHSRWNRVARGKREGVPIEVRFTQCGTGYERTSAERQWTEVDVYLPPGYGLALYVRRYDWTDQHQVERGTMVDIELGDAEFDRQFLVEAAPAQIASSLLGPAIRGLLARHEAVTLTTEWVDGRSVVRLAVATWIEYAAITAAIDTLLVLSTGVRDAYARLESMALRDTGSPYRPRCDGEQVDAQRAALADEVTMVARLRGNR